MNFSRNYLLDMGPMKKKQKMTLNITYHPALKNVGNIFNEIHLLLAPNEEHRKVFSCVSNLVLALKTAKALIKQNLQPWTKIMAKRQKKTALFLTPQAM